MGEVEEEIVGLCGGNGDEEEYDGVDNVILDLLNIGEGDVQGKVLTAINLMQ